MSKQTLYVVGRDTGLYDSPEKAWDAWGRRDEDWTLDTWILKDGCLHFEDTIHEGNEHECAEFYKKVVLANRIKMLQETIEDAQKNLAKAQDEMNKK